MPILITFLSLDWTQFVAIETNKWLDMATNWTVFSTPEQVLVIHYENVKHDLLSEMRKILNFLHLPVDELRLQCLEKYKKGLFRRKEIVTKKEEKGNVIPFSKEIRSSMDKLVDHLNQHILIKRGYESIPLDKYKYYKQVRFLTCIFSKGNALIFFQTDEEILQDLKNKKKQPKIDVNESEDNQLQNDRTHGTKMLLKQYMKWLDINVSNFFFNKERRA